MAQLLVIDTNTYHPPNDEIGDIVGVFDDKHKFSERELKNFKVVSVKGSRVDVQTRLQESRPKKSRIFQDAKTLLWSFKEPDGDIKNEKEVWKNPTDNKWYYLEEDPKFVFTLKDLINTEKALLETTDVSTINAAKDAAYVKITKRLADIPKNNTEVQTGITKTEIEKYG